MHPTINQIVHEIWKFNTLLKKGTACGVVSLKHRKRMAGTIILQKYRFSRRANKGDNAAHMRMEYNLLNSGDMAVSPEKGGGDV